MLKSINKTYNNEETRPAWKVRLIAIIIIIVVTVMLFISTNLILFGGSILGFIGNFVNLPENLRTPLLYIIWVAGYLTLVLTALFVYYVTPNVKSDTWTRLMSIIPGSMFFCLFWLLGSWLFALYVENFGKYNETFGFLGGVMALLTWLYFSSLIILTGGAINSEYYERISNRYSARTK